GDRALGAGVLDLTGPEVLAGTVVAAGAALLPDIDHSSATIARSAGAVSKLASSAISSAAGHRGATHTLLAVAGFTLAGVLVTKVDWAVDAPVGEQIEIATTAVVTALRDRKSTRLNSSHVSISYAVFCLKKKTKRNTQHCAYYIDPTRAPHPTASDSRRAPR